MEELEEVVVIPRDLFDRVEYALSIMPELGFRKLSRELMDCLNVNQSAVEDVIEVKEVKVIDSVVFEAGEG